MIDNLNKTEIFISYSWSEESDKIATEIDNAFINKGVTIIRDKRDAGYKTDIDEFMQRIGKGSCIILVISNSYLTKRNCMYELIKIAENSNLYERIFPIVLHDAKIYQAIDRIEYTMFWNNKLLELNTKVAQYAQQGIIIGDEIESITRDIRLFKQFKERIDNLIDTLRKMNTLSVDIMQKSNYQELFNAIDNKINSEKSPFFNDLTNGSKTFVRSSIEKQQIESLYKPESLDIINNQLNLADLNNDLVISNKNCEIDYSRKNGTFIDERDENIYKWVRLGDQIWLAENFRYIPYVCSPNEQEADIWVFAFDDNNLVKAKQSFEYKKYGCLYAYKAAINCAPKGWRLPDKRDISILISNYINYKQAFIQLLIEGNSGFNAILGGGHLKWFLDKPIGYYKVYQKLKVYNGHGIPFLKEYVYYQKGDVIEPWGGKGGSCPFVFGKIFLDYLDFAFWLLNEEICYFSKKDNLIKTANDWGYGFYVRYIKE